MRTEEQKLLQEPVKVLLGGKEYEIKPLPIKYASPWRRKFITLMGEASALASVTSDDKDGFLKALSELLTDKPDRLVDLLFEYMPNLKRDEIESQATSSEILNALEEVVAFEAPFLGAAIRITKAMQKNLV